MYTFILVFFFALFIFHNFSRFLMSGSPQGALREIQNKYIRFYLMIDYISVTYLQFIYSTTVFVFTFLSILFFYLILLHICFSFKAKDILFYRYTFVGFLTYKSISIKLCYSCSILFHHSILYIVSQSINHGAIFSIEQKFHCVFLFRVVLSHLSSVKCQRAFRFRLKTDKLFLFLKAPYKAEIQLKKSCFHEKREKLTSPFISASGYQVVQSGPTNHIGNFVLPALRIIRENLISVISLSSTLASYI